MKNPKKIDANKKKSIMKALVSAILPVDTRYMGSSLNFASIVKWI